MMAVRTALAMQFASSVPPGSCCGGAPCSCSTSSLHSLIAVAIMVVNWKWSAMLHPIDRLTPEESNFRRNSGRIQLPKKKMVPPRVACFSLERKEPAASILYWGGIRTWRYRIIPIDRNQPTAGRLTCIVKRRRATVMKAPGRNDVIRVIAVMSVVAFPLIADAQLGLGSKTAKISNDVSPLAGGAVKAAIAGPNSCADQHWPFLSNGCLRGSTESIEPRLVSMSVEPSMNSAATHGSPRVVGSTDAARGDAPVAKPKKLIKPRVASHKPGRSNISVKYAVNSENGSLAGW